MDQAVLARHELDEGAVRHDADDLAGVDLAPLDPDLLGQSPGSAERLASAPLGSADETETVPSSWMSILVPVSSWIDRIILPPGPMTAPIFSGLILTRSTRGANSESSVTRRADRLHHLVEDEQATVVRLRQRLAHESRSDAP